MTVHHNKKRNVGVIHEQLVRYVGAAMISNNEKLAEVAMGILTKHFSAGTELHREFRLFNALVNVPMGDKDIARLVINEARHAASKHDKQKLMQEKSQLIKAINHTLSEARFYDIRVPNYKLYATVQSLLENWRGVSAMEIGTVAKYEHTLTEWVARKKEQPEVKESTGDPLVYKLMLQNFQKKYSKELLPTQKMVIESAMLKDPATLSKELAAARDEALRTLQEFKKTCNNAVLMEKIDRVIESVSDFKPTTEESNVSKTLQLLELVSELKGNDNE